MLARMIETALVSLSHRLAQRPRSRPPHGGGPQPGPSAHASPGRQSPDILLGHTLPPAVAASFPFAPPQESSAPRPVTLSPEARRRHLYAIGSTGCGKTNLLLRLIEADVAAGRTFCVVDLRGDLIDRVLPRLAVCTQDPASTGARLLLLDLRRAEAVVGFNPLAGPGDAYARAFHTLGVLRGQAESWGVQLEETLRNALLALAETGWSLLEVEPLLCHDGFRETVLPGVTDPHVRSFFARYGALSEDRRSQWALPVLNKVTPLLSVPVLRRTLGQRRGFSFGPLLDTPGQVVLISLAVDRLHGAAHLMGGLLISALQTAVMERVDTPEASRNPVNLYVDEFETMATERFGAIIAEGRRFGLGLTLSHQNLTQIEPGLRQMVLNNVQTQLYFQTGAADAGELSAEVMTGGPRSEVRSALIRQGVGECHLVRRGEDSVRLKVAHCPDPKCDPAALRSLLDASFSAFARPASEADAELRLRHEALETVGKTIDIEKPAGVSVMPGAPPPPPKPKTPPRPKASPLKASPMEAVTPPEAGISPPPKAPPARTAPVPAASTPIAETLPIAETPSPPPPDHALPEAPAAPHVSAAPPYEVRHGKTTRLRHARPASGPTPPGGRSPGDGDGPAP